MADFERELFPERPSHPNDLPSDFPESPPRPQRPPLQRAPGRVEPRSIPRSPVLPPREALIDDLTSDQTLYSSYKECLFAVEGHLSVDVTERFSKCFVKNSDYNPSYTECLCVGVAAIARAAGREHKYEIRQLKDEIAEIRAD
jgi:hypothetical protein